MFEAAYQGSSDAVFREVLQYVRRFNLEAGSADVLHAVSAGAYFQMYSGFLDLQFAIPLSEKGRRLRPFAHEICVSSLFGKRKDAGDGSRCSRGLRPDDS
eukprot:15175354-Alexandrium_andersonii.AAC.1